MGNARSSEIRNEESNEICSTNGNATSTPQGNNIFEPTETISSEREQRRKELEEDFEKFKQDLARKHERRKQLISEKRKEMTDLREELIKEKEENSKLRSLLESKNKTTQEDPPFNTKFKEIINNLQEQNEELRNELERTRLILSEKDSIVDKNKELRISLAEMQKELQSVNTQVIDFEKERIDYQEHVTALKDVIRVTKEMLKVRENQITELKKKLTTIEELLASKEVSILSDDLRQEYERQLQNIKDLRILYQERQRVDTREKDNLKSQIEDLKKLLEETQKKSEEFETRVNELESDNSTKYDKIINLESNLGLSNAECKELQAEMSVINQLFSQILISFNNEQDIDLDNLIKLLEENHGLLTNIAINDEHSEASALPKVLLDLVKQVNENKKESMEEIATPTENVEVVAEPEEDTQLPSTHQLNSPEEIVENLPKVWRVLIELLSHQTAPSNDIADKKNNENDNHCFKSVQTPTGLRKVVSVSKTFIRLKSLILEKKSLEKEMNRLKHLNTHLEGRLQDQEKRLVLVSSELSKTWNVVGMMQKQHHQLHTQEKILRYELAQKRKLLTELKEELEYCRQKWLQAREQNTSTEEQWKQLRTEFASRKQNLIDDINNSVESGYSDEKSSSDDDIPDSDVNEETEQGIKNNNEKVEESKEVGDQNINKCSILDVVQSEVDEIVGSFNSDSTTEIQNKNIEVVDLENDITNIKQEDLNEKVPEETEIETKIHFENVPSTSTETVVKNPIQAAEEFVARREARMKLLEEQCSELYFSVAKTSLKGAVLSNKLNNLHETYGSQSQELPQENAGSENVELENNSNRDDPDEPSEETQENNSIN
ncbi:putative leucine-rich repeat-containing protein DDB_G0290503 [Onthophagus taurus]|uniref:putative leucine-rich repeat-containing protein DDB_G0290503 n=1 Tax=Onthophagus taurus TaxID=166361 RepID=UPI0039BDF511